MKSTIEIHRLKPVATKTKPVCAGYFYTNFLSQSTRSNEELITTVEELRTRNLDLQQVNNDVTNLLASINIPILMLANDLRIRSFTPMAQRLFNLILRMSVARLATSEPIWRFPTWKR